MTGEYNLSKGFSQFRTLCFSQPRFGLCYLHWKCPIKFNFESPQFSNISVNIQKVNCDSYKLYHCDGNTTFLRLCSATCQSGSVSRHVWREVTQNTRITCFQKEPPVWLNVVYLTYTLRCRFHKNFKYFYHSCPHKNLLLLFLCD